MRNICIVIPAYNEEKRIKSMLESFTYYFERLRKENILNYEMLIVINNTTDRTEDVVKEWRKKNPRIRYLNFKQGGKRFAIIEGFKEAIKGNYDYIGFVDADLATPPGAYYKLIEGIEGHDCCIANRHMASSKITFSLKRKITSEGFNFVVRSLMMIPFHDTQCGAKLFNRKCILEILEKPGTANWAFDVEILYNLWKKKYRINEVPTEWNL